MTPHKTMHWVGGVTFDKGVSWYSVSDLYQEDVTPSLDCASSHQLQYVRILSEVGGETDPAVIAVYENCLKAIRVYDTWWQNLKKELES